MSWHARAKRIGVGAQAWVTIAGTGAVNTNAAGAGPATNATMISIGCQVHADPRTAGESATATAALRRRDAGAVAKSLLRYTRTTAIRRRDALLAALLRGAFALLPFLVLVLVPRTGFALC